MNSISLFHITIFFVCRGFCFVQPVDSFCVAFALLPRWHMSGFALCATEYAG